MSFLTKEKQKIELEQEEIGMEFSPEKLEVNEELEVTEEKEQKKKQLNNKEKK